MGFRDATRPSVVSGRIWVVSKSDVGVGAPYVIGAFLNHALALAACCRVGTYMVAEVDPNRSYHQGEMLDVEVILVDSLSSAKMG